MSGKLTLTIHRARNLLACDVDGLSDPFVKISFGTQTTRTRTISSTLSPQWDQTFTFLTTKRCVNLRLEVFDDDLVSSPDFMGYVSMDFEASDDASNVGEAWLTLHGMTQKDYQAARSRNGVHAFGEIYVQWWFSYSQFGRYLLTAQTTEAEDGTLIFAEDAKPHFEMASLKNGINRFTNAAYYLCVPYWWLMSRLMWDNAVESGASLGLVLFLWWYGKLHILLPLAMTLTMISNFHRFHRWGPDGAPLAGQRPYSLSETVDWYKETLHYTQIYCAWLSDMGDSINEVFYWMQPQASAGLFRVCVGVVLLHVVGLMPSGSTLGMLILLYMFTLYPLAYYFPKFYAFVMMQDTRSDPIDEHKLDVPSSSVDASATPRTPRDLQDNDKRLLEFSTNNVASCTIINTPVWQPKRRRERCLACQSNFGVLSLKVHCRCCGEVFCGKCAPPMNLSSMAATVTSASRKPQRVCTVCIAFMTRHSALWKTGIKVDVWWRDDTRLRGVLLVVEDWRPVSGTTTLVLGTSIRVMAKDIRCFQKSTRAGLYTIDVDNATYSVELMTPRTDAVHVDALMALLA
eukprot:PhM_4_TR3652/c0_g1_i1/m.23766